MPNDVPAVDTGNHILRQVPSQLSGTVATAPDGSKLLILTVRTTSATVTVMLSRDDVKTWHELIGKGLRQMGSGLVIPTLNLPTLNLPPEFGQNGSGQP